MLNRRIILALFAALAGIAAIGAWWNQSMAERELDATTFLNSLAISPDGNWVAAGSRERWVTCWSVVQKERVFQNHELTMPQSLAFSPDSQQLLYSGHGFLPKVLAVKPAEILVRDVPSFVQRQRISVLGGVVDDATWGPDETANAIYRQQVGRWELKYGTRIKSYDMPSSTLDRLLVTSQGRWLAYGPVMDAPNSIEVYDVGAGRKLFAHERPLPSVVDRQLSPDGRWLAVGGLGSDQHGRLQIWDLDSGKLAAESNLDDMPVQVSFAHAAPAQPAASTSASAAAPAANAVTLWTMCANGRCLAWSYTELDGLKAWKTIDTPERTVYMARWSVDGKRAAIASELWLTVVDLENSQRVCVLSDRMALHARRRRWLVGRYFLFALGVGLAAWAYVTPKSPEE